MVFARWPRAGAVKSRLSPALPASLACALYEDMLRDVLQAGRTATVDERWVYFSDAPEPPPSYEPAAGYRPSAQRGADLGERLERAMEERLGAGERLVVIGGDAPELSGATISAAFAALETHDVSLGPTPDGGYYLLGLRRRAPEILRGIPWGTDRVLARTLERAEERHLRVATLEPLEDVDTPADLVRLLIRCHEHPLACPHTTAGLRRLGLLPEEGR